MAYLETNRPLYVPGDNVVELCCNCNEKEADTIDDLCSDCEELSKTEEGL